MIGPLLGSVAALWLAALYSVSLLSLAMFVVAYVLTTLGLTVGFHRCFTHRAFRTSPAMETILIVLGSMGLQGPLLFWVATHRLHHRFSDREGDPHSPHCLGTTTLGRLTGFWHSHIGWLFAARVCNPLELAPDLFRQPRVFRVQQHYWVWVSIGLATPPILSFAIAGTWYTALEGFLWAGPVRLLLVHHASWAVGSVSHLCGQRPFRTNDHSANNLWVAVLAFGEGLQNNHHAFPSAARHAFRWWEPDLTGLVISTLSRAGLVWDLRRPSFGEIADRRRHTRGESENGR